MKEVSKENLKEVSLEVSHRCSLNCKFCSSDACNPSKLKYEMSTSKLLEIMRDGREIGATELSLSGGEPSIHKDIMELLRYSGKLGFTTLFYTCGNCFDKNENLLPLSEEFIRKAKALTNGNLKMIFDVQGCDAQTVDKLMNKKGAFDNIITSIKNTIKVGGIVIEAHTVPMSRNFKYLFETRAMLEELGVKKQSFLRWVPQGRSAENEELALSPKQFLELQFMFLRMYEEEKQKPDMLKIRLGHPIDNLALVDPRYPFRHCRGGVDAPLIKPNGDIDCCPSMKGLPWLTAGNVCDESFTNIWERSKYYKIFRDFIYNGGWKGLTGACRDCRFLSQCRGKCVSQRLYFNAPINMPMEQAILIGADPLCPIANNLL